MTEPLVIQMLRENRAALLAREELQTRRLAETWLGIERSLQTQMLLLSEEIVAAREAGKVITEQLIARLTRYKNLQAQLRTQILKYAKEEAVPDITREQLAYAQLGIEAAAGAIGYQYLLGATFNTLSADQVTALAGLLGDGTPLYRLLKEAYPDSLDAIIKALLEGTAQGLSATQIATELSRALGIGLDRIMLIARTEQLRAWRYAMQQQYQRSGVVLYHVRLSARDSRTCMACLVADGEKIPVDEVLSDHPRGRCTSYPVVRGAPAISIESGQDWFLHQPADVQKEMMGPGRYNLWKEKNFDLDKLYSKTYDPVWGSSPRVTTLDELLRSIRT